MASKKKTTSKLQEIEDLFVQGDKDSLKAIENLEKSLAEYKKIGDSVKVADTLFEIGRTYANLGRRFYWEAIFKGGIDDPSLPDGSPPLEIVGPDDDPSVPDVPDTSRTIVGPDDDPSLPTS